MNEALTDRIYNSYVVVTEMFNDRGYVFNHTETGPSREAFVAAYGTPPDRSRILVVGQHRGDPAKTILATWVLKTGVHFIRKFHQRLTDEETSGGIIISDCKMTPMAMRELDELNANGPVRLESFLESELQMNVIKHVLVPPHTALTDSDKQLLLKRYKMKASQLPRIQIDDPIVRYYGLVRGQVVKIVRPSETAGRYVTYRVVV